MQGQDEGLWPSKPGPKGFNHHGRTSTTSIDGDAEHAPRRATRSRRATAATVPHFRAEVGWVSCLVEIENSPGS